MVVAGRRRSIAFSIALSAFNSLTFTPALAALVLEGEKEAQGGFFGKVEAALRRLTSWYTTTSGHALRHRRHHPLHLVRSDRGHEGAGRELEFQPGRRLAAAILTAA